MPQLLFWPHELPRLPPAKVSLVWQSRRRRPRQATPGFLDAGKRGPRIILLNQLLRNTFRHSTGVRNRLGGVGFYEQIKKRLVCGGPVLYD